MRHNSIVVALFLGVSTLVSSCDEGAKTATTELSVPVTIEEVKYSSIEVCLNSNGTAKALKEVTLSSEMAGEYSLGRNPRTGKAWKLGDSVNKGETIVRLEDQEYENDISIDIKKLDLEVAKLEYEKQNSLLKLGGVTQREVKDSEISYKNSETAYTGAEYELAKMAVKAPFKGVITSLPMVTNGTEVASGTEIVSLMDYSKVYIDINVPEKYISTLNVGFDAYITSYTLPKDTIAGVIVQLSPAIDEDTRTFSGIIEVENQDMKIRPGMFIKADIITESATGVVVVDKELLLSKRGGKSLFVVKNGAAESRTVKIGLENNDRAEIISGLDENDRLIITGYETLQNRSKIKIVK